MVVHQYVGVQPGVGAKQWLVEHVQASMAVSLIEEAVQSMVAALHDMLRDTWQGEPRLSGHGHRIGARP